MVGKVYSYMRFSTPEQSKGHSLQRQTEYATQYALDNGLVLDESLTMRDEGLSAYHQKHISKGALGVFCKAIDDGLVDPGSVLIVENLDRLHRGKVREAMPFLLNIVNAGITVITAADGREYSQASLDNNHFQLFESLSIMSRAHEESETKSKRVKAAIVSQIEHWIQFGSGKVIRNGRDPYWVKAKKDKTGFELVEERAVIIREIIRLFHKGWGMLKIQRHLNEHYRPFKGEQWYACYVNSVLKNRTLIGERSFIVNDKKYIINNYYPALITNTEFALLQNELKNRAPTRSQQAIPGIITGNRVSFCGHCGSRLTAQNHKARTYNGKQYPITSGLRRIRCNSRMSGVQCPATAINSGSIAVSISAPTVERALLEYCADQMELSAILNDDTDKSRAIKAQIGKLQRQTSEAETVINNGNEQITRLLIAGHDVSPITNVITQHQTKLADLQTKISKLEDDLRFQKVHKSADLIAQWEQVKVQVQDMDEETRLLIRQIVKKTFKRMDIYFHSFGKSDTGKMLRLPIDDQSIVMMLTFINDKTRILVIDRKSGDWVKGGDMVINESGVLLDLADLHLSGHEVLV